VTSLGAIEQWDAQRSIGNLTAKKMMDRAIELASDHGIGLVALRNANHWMRGGSYGWQAAEKGYIGICWTNSIAVMPPWGAKECRIGTNPLIVAIPSTPITMVDMSMSMFSYGMLEVNRLAGRELPVGGFDDEGQPDQRTGRYREKPPYSADGLLERFRPVHRAGYDCHPAFQRLFRCRSHPGKQR
jgi:3-dehydro-L-gulonate 2-dehydrogenase